MRHDRTIPIVIVVTIATLMSADTSAAQEYGSPRLPSVTYEAPVIKTVYARRATTIDVPFRVAAGYHINSNRPNQKYLKKTELRLDASAQVVIEKISYPLGVDRSLPFAPNQKLNVYTDNFTVKVVVRPLTTSLPAQYAIHGVLKYQACDNVACYPPKQLPVSFEVKVMNVSSPRHSRS